MPGLSSPSVPTLVLTHPFQTTQMGAFGLTAEGCHLLTGFLKKKLFLNRSHFQLGGLVEPWEQSELLSHQHPHRLTLTGEGA